MTKPNAWTQKMIYYTYYCGSMIVCEALKRFNNNLLRKPHWFSSTFVVHIRLQVKKKKKGKKEVPPHVFDHWAPCQISLPSYLLAAGLMWRAATFPLWLWRSGASTLGSVFESNKVSPCRGGVLAPGFSHVLMESSCAKGHSLLHTGSAGMFGAAHTRV